MKKQYLYIASTYFVITIYACNLGDKNLPKITENKVENVNLIQQKLEGYWKLRKANANNEMTSRLDGTYFEFTKDNDLNTNLPTINNGHYVVQTDSVIVHSAETKVDYKIEAIGDTTLVLNLKARNFEFDLHFGKEEKLLPIQ